MGQVLAGTGWPPVTAAFSVGGLKFGTLRADIPKCTHRGDASGGADRNWNRGRSCARWGSPGADSRGTVGPFFFAFFCGATKDDSPAWWPGCPFRCRCPAGPEQGGSRFPCRTSTWLGRCESQPDAAGQSEASLPGPASQTQAYLQRSSVRRVSVREGRSGRERLGVELAAGRALGAGSDRGAGAATGRTAGATAAGRETGGV